jgi:hypothetical protein
VDEEEYAVQNLRLLSELPVFPGARPVSTIRDQCAGRDAGASASGFLTSRSFGLPRETSRARARLIRFYKTRMRGWRVQEEVELRQLGFRRGDQYVRMLVISPRDYVLSVDHRGDACPAP